jgi:glycosyltransferase involved in cell wall biosynthesis
MRINHFITTISRGGAENQLLILCREQKSSGHDVSVTPLKGQLDLLNDFESENIEVDLSFHGKNFALQVIKKIVGKRRKEEFQHAHLPQAELLLAFSLQQKYFVTRHYGSAFFPRKPRLLSNLLSRLAAKKATRVIAISEFVGEYLVKSGEISSSKKVVVVPYGFDTHNFVSGLGEQELLRQPNFEQLKVGTLARLSSEKDLCTLIRGFNIFHCSFSPRSTLEIFGEGPELEPLKDLITSLKMQDSVFLMGKTSNPARALSQIDVFVLSSKFEGFGMVYLEAMATSRIILASKIAAAVEVLGTSGAATFFEVENELDLSIKLGEVRHVDRSKMRAEQKKRLELFSSDVMAKLIQEIYEQNPE